MIVSHAAFVLKLGLLEEPLQSPLLTHLSGPGGECGGAGALLWLCSPGWLGVLHPLPSTPQVLSGVV